MPVPYSEDLRWRAVWMHVFLKQEAEEVARVLMISPRSVFRYSERYTVTGEVRPFAKRSGPQRELSEFEEDFLLSIVLRKPGLYLRELQDEIYSALLHWVDCSTILRTLHRIGVSHQVMKHYAIQRSELRRSEFWLEFHLFQPHMIIWIDETGFDKRNGIRKYSYGIRGLTPFDCTLKLRGKRYSGIGILTTDGVEYVHIVDEKVDGEVFLTFVRKYLLPLLMPFNGSNCKSVVVLDHVSPVIQTIESVGAIVRFLPPYSPDMNPIEEVFSEVKQYLKANSDVYQATASPEQIILSAFVSVSKQNCNAYINHAGYY